MSKTVISVENLTKRYDLGVISTGTLSRDFNRWWARLLGQLTATSHHLPTTGTSITSLVLLKVF